MCCRTPSVRVQPPLLWPSGWRPTFSTRTSWRGSSRWRRSTRASWSVYTHEQSMLGLYWGLLSDALSLFPARNLRKTENRKNRLEKELNSVGERVLELKEKYRNHTIFSFAWKHWEIFHVHRIVDFSFNQIIIYLFILIVLFI